MRIIFKSSTYKIDLLLAYNSFIYPNIPSVIEGIFAIPLHANCVTILVRGSNAMESAFLSTWSDSLQFLNTYSRCNIEL